MGASMRMLVGLYMVLTMAFAHAQSAIQGFEVLNKNRSTLLTLDTLRIYSDSDTLAQILYTAFEGAFLNMRTMDNLDLPTMFKNKTFNNSRDGVEIDIQEAANTLIVTIKNRTCDLRSRFLVQKAVNDTITTIKIRVVEVIKTTSLEINGRTHSERTTKDLSREIVEIQYSNSSPFTACQIAFAVLANLGATEFSNIE